MAAQDSNVEQELDQLISHIGNVTQKLQNGGKPVDNTKLLLAIKKLAWTLEGPEIGLVNLAMAPVGYAALRTAIELELFQKFGEGPKHVSELAKELNVSNELLARIMRVLVSHGIYEFSAPLTYTHTIQSMILANPLPLAVVRGLAEQADMLPKLPDYLASISYKNPPSGKESFFPFAHDSPLTKYEWLEEHPDKLKIFHDFQSAKDEMTGEKLKDRLKAIVKREGVRYEGSNKDNNGAELPVLFCDVGGGRGKLLKEATNELLREGEKINGRVIVEDLPNVVKDLEKAEVWEAVPHNFFDPQPIKGACVYQLRDVLHNWSDDASRTILANTKAAMTPHSRILIAETVLPDMDTPAFLANMDIYMMQFGGLERTEEEWRQLMLSAGLQLDSIEVPESGDRLGEKLLWVSIKA